MQESSANETAARTAIEQGITNALGSNKIVYTNQQVYLRNLTGGQALGLFDKVASSGTQRWAFNFVNATETYQNTGNLTPSFYTLEMSDIGTSEITLLVQNFINGTKQ